MTIEQRLLKLGLNPRKALYDYEIENFARNHKIKYWRGVFDREKLPKSSFSKEAIIINLDDAENPGTHWVALRKYKPDMAIYFDSYGNLPPPKEILSYLKNCKILYNTINFQGRFANICGHLCLEFLINTNNL